MKNYYLLFLLSILFHGTLSEASSSWCPKLAGQELHNCLNEKILPKLISYGENAYQETIRNLVQAKSLDLNHIRPQSFQSYYFPKADNYRIEIVGQRIDGSGAFFNLDQKKSKTESAFTPAVAFEKNLVEVLRFLGFYHGRNFGRQNSLLFHIARVEVSASSKQSDEGLMYFTGNTLRVNLPLNRSIHASELIKFWNEGNIFLSKNQAKVPRFILEKMGSYFGGLKEKIGIKVLENWQILNPISDFRTSLHAVYLKNAEHLIGLIKNDDEQSLSKRVLGAQSQLQFHQEMDWKNIGNQMVNNLMSYDYVADSLDSFFQQMSDDGSNKNGSIHVVNRATLMCFVKVSNSHMIKVTWDESNFGKGEVANENISIETGLHKVKVNAKQKQNVHVVNDFTGLGFVCVDTNDNVEVDLNGLLRTLASKMDQKALIRMSLRPISL